MKKIILFSLFIFCCFLGFTQSQSFENEEITEYIKQNTQVTDFGILGLSEGFYTRTLKVINISGEKKNIRAFIFQNEEFVDDGEGFDLKVNDGVLTSKLKYKNKSSISAGESRIVSNALIVDRKYADSPEQRSSANFNSKIKIGVTCDVSVVPCCNCTADCRACKWGWWPHRCVEVSNCKVDVGLEW